MVGQHPGRPGVAVGGIGNGDVDHAGPEGGGATQVGELLGRGEGGQQLTGSRFRRTGGDRGKHGVATTELAGRLEFAHHPSIRARRKTLSRTLPRDLPPMPWFVKTETIQVAPAAARPHLAAHRAWVAELRAQGIRISSGYLVDGEGRPGGGGLLLLEATDHASAEALIRQDPMLRSSCVTWSLHGWISAVGDLDLA